MRLSAERQASAARCTLLRSVHITVQALGTQASPLLGSVSVKAMSSSTTPGSSGSFTCSRHWVLLCGDAPCGSVAALSLLPLREVSCLQDARLYPQIW